MTELADRAVGIVEVRGLAAAILVGDVMAKTSAVRLVGRREVGAGLVALVVEGDIASVDAAVGAARGSSAVQSSSVVLGRPATGVLALLGGAVEPASDTPPRASGNRSRRPATGTGKA